MWAGQSVGLINDPARERAKASRSLSARRAALRGLSERVDIG
jgi:hypothetical protein